MDAVAAQCIRSVAVIATGEVRDNCVAMHFRLQAPNRLALVSLDQPPALCREHCVAAMSRMRVRRNLDPALQSVSVDDRTHFNGVIGQTFYGLDRACAI